MKRRTVILLIFFGCFILFSDVALACSCGVYEPPEAFESSRAVFIGKVKETGGWINPYAVIKVEKSWKSVETDEVIVYTGYGCDPLNLKENETYLIYTFDDEVYYKTGSCSRTAEITLRENDLTYLESKSTISLRKEIITHNARIGLVTGAVVLIFISIGLFMSRRMFAKAKRV